MEKIGVIEGFYGIPYTFEERRSMIGFLSDIGMNTYVYAPKDDPYHNIKWREPYPEDKLDQLEKLANFAQSKQVRFIWAIHPGQNIIDFDNYESEIEKLFKKYESLYNKGIRSFALCMDDIDRDEAYEQRDFHLRLVRDILDFIKDFACDDLLFVHPWYNEAWIDDKGKEYFEKFKGLDRLSIMWTGSDVVVPLSKSSNDKFIELAGKRAHIWFNWPVNDYLRDQIFMEIFEFFDSRDINYDSILINPMNQSELSKISIYQIGEFIKNPLSYNPLLAFKKALAYVDEKVSDELLTISDSFFGSGVYDRSENKKYLAEAKIAKAYKDKDKDLILEAIDQKLYAIESYFKNYTNEKLFEEVEAFFLSLKYLLLAIKNIIEENKDLARSFYQKSKEPKVRVYKEYSNFIVEEREVKTSKILEEIYSNLEGVD